ncbi:MAG: TldD/PmbA family protein [Ignisphaera sp.]|nr:TldD/PmbA family protein [Ignisphaera sp.]MCX8167669.1 TldD/PmbA family protein [Ignisphaera sp.]MDW8085659.1 TldD/PmbA family protein [Ignisphaera sp.]
MDLHRIVERGLKKAEMLGGSEAEIFIVRELSTSILGTRKGLENIECGESTTVSIRLAIGKRTTLQTSVLSGEEHIDRIVEDAIKVARVAPEDRDWVSLPKSLGKTPVYDIVDDRVREPDLEMFIELIKRGLEGSREIDRRVYTSEAKLSLSHFVRVIGNTNYSPIESEKTMFSYVVMIKAAENGEETGYHNYYIAPTLNEFRLDKVVEDAVRIALASLKAKPIETGKYQVLLTPRVFSSILSSLIVPAVRADMVIKNRSPLKNKLYSEVLSEKLTIIDDGAAPNMPSSSEFDDEGIATSRKTLIDRGVLVSYLYDTYTANIDGRASTGNARRTSSMVYPDATNVIVLPGAQSLDSLTRDVRRGVIVYGTIGEWLSNPVSGYLNATVTNGVYIENGEERHAIKGIVVSGNIYEVLGRELVTVTKEYENVGSMMVPSAFVERISVAGK